MLQLARAQLARRLHEPRRLLGGVLDVRPVFGQIDAAHREAPEEARGFALKDLAELARVVLDARG
eukprot:8857068-Lingulodinium_polyedra.AAC.1